MGSSASEVRRFVGTAAVFAASAVVVYGLLYVWAERLVRTYAKTNKFLLVQSTPAGEVDFLVLGASHAAALGYQDMTARLEAMTGKRILNLAIVGGGVHVSRLMYYYFLSHHGAGGLVYVIDSFTFYSPQWNEDRLQDRRLFLRAPFDAKLVMRLLHDPSTRRVGIDYTLGFSKINNEDRFTADVSPEEQTRFTRTYRPVRQLDDERMAYLYPAQIDPATLDRYLGDFDALLRDAQARRMRVLVVKPPIPTRVLERIPGEDVFDRRLRELLARRDVAFEDFSRVGNDEAFFYDTDHLNQAGVVNFFGRALAPVLNHAY